ncbi:hypothetical protein Mame01_26140 [Microbispora amethystogenes]|nr:hypothetical protein Mame01_26140 [Microbispora amethystogenes]
MEPYETSSGVAEAVRAQSALRNQLDLTNILVTAPEFVAGLDVSYEVDSRYAAAAAVLIELRSLEVVETAIAYGEVIISLGCWRFVRFLFFGKRLESWQAGRMCLFAMVTESLIRGALDWPVT